MTVPTVLDTSLTVPRRSHCTHSAREEVIAGLRARPNSGPIPPRNSPKTWRVNSYHLRGTSLLEYFYRWPAGQRPLDELIALIVLEADGHTTITAVGDGTVPQGYISLDDAVNWAATCPRQVFVSLQDGAVWPSKYLPLVH